MPYYCAYSLSLMSPLKKWHSSSSVNSSQYWTLIAPRRSQSRFPPRGSSHGAAIRAVKSGTAQVCPRPATSRDWQARLLSLPHNQRCEFLIRGTSTGGHRTMIDILARKSTSHAEDLTSYHSTNWRTSRSRAVIVSSRSPRAACYAAQPRSIASSGCNCTTPGASSRCAAPASSTRRKPPPKFARKVGGSCTRRAHLIKSAGQAA